MEKSKEPAEESRWLPWLREVFEKAAKDLASLPEWARPVVKKIDDVDS